MKLTIAISPCPNDTFIFDALLHQKIDTEGLQFEPIFLDVQQLNEAALVQKYDVTKLSYFAYSFVSQNYILLNSGSALGNNCGPILIAKNKFSDTEITKKNITIPGKYTTANFLFSIKYPLANNKTFLVFNEIENAITNNDVDAGVIIHENRFTYEQKGLCKIVDLGEYWQQKYNLPIPLGGIVTRKIFDLELQKKIDRIIKKSIEFAFENPNSSTQFTKQYAQEMDDEVIQKHIQLYVNNYSIDLGKNGKNAIEKLFEIALAKNIISSLHYPILLA